MPAHAHHRLHHRQPKRRRRQDHHRGQSRGRAWPERKIPTLLIDLDPQANATSALGIEKQEGKSLYGALRGEGEALPLVTPTAYEHLAIIPSEEDLAAAEIELAQMDNYLMKLRGASSSPCALPAASGRSSSTARPPSGCSR